MHFNEVAVASGELTRLGDLSVRHQKDMTANETGASGRRKFDGQAGGVAGGLDLCGSGHARGKIPITDLNGHPGGESVFLPIQLEGSQSAGAWSKEREHTTEDLDAVVGNIAVGGDGVEREGKEDH